MKKVIIFSFIIFSTLFLSGCGPKKSSKVPTNVPKAQPTPYPTKPIEQSIGERPFVSILPTSDSHWLTLEVKNIPAGTKNLEYELLYFADVEGNKIERGVSTIGQPALLESQTDFLKKILLGTASCTTGTCKYKYDEGVTEGTLSLVFDGTTKYDTPFKLQKGKEATSGLTADNTFSFVASGLVGGGVYLTMSSIGVLAQLPTGVTPKVIPYGIFSSSAIKAGTVSFKTSLTSVSIYGFNGKSWSKLNTQVSGGEAKATSSGQNIFILAE